MKKKVTGWIALLLCSMMLLSGCAKAMELTEEENDAIAEYIAYMMLKYDRTYHSKLSETIETTDNPSIVEEEFEDLVKDETKLPSDETGEDQTENEGGVSGAPDGSKPDQNDSATENTKLADLFSDKSVHVKFVGYEECMLYPEGAEDSYFSLVAPEGTKWAVMKFSVLNPLEKQLHYSQLDSEIRYRLDLSATTIVKPSMTLLMNDLQYMDVTLEPGEERTAVVVFSVDADQVLSGANLVIYNERRTAIEKLK